MRRQHSFPGRLHFPGRLLGGISLKSLRRCFRTILVIGWVPVGLPATASAEVQGLHVTTHHTLNPSAIWDASKGSPQRRAPDIATAPKVVAPAAPIAVVKPRDVLCVAGCPDGATPPQLIHSGRPPSVVPMAIPETKANRLEQHSTAIFCYNGGGCKSRGFYRPSIGSGYYDAEPDDRQRRSRATIYVIER
jgi:hypothetical protein